jgi:hypothetical protein
MLGARGLIVIFSEEEANVKVAIFILQRFGL